MIPIIIRSKLNSNLISKNSYLISKKSYLISKNSYLISKKSYLISKNPVSDEKPLGRWKNESIDKTNLKIDLANEDHCGVCSEFLEKSLKDIDKINKLEKK
jgi:hypothetical protein